MINQEDYLEYCERKLGVTHNFPFDKSTWAMRVGDKIFALADIDSWEFINLKCDPDKALELRAENPGITGAYHMSKKHWNSVSLKGEVDAKLILELIDHSYDLVFKSLTKKKQQEILDTANG